MNIPPVSDIMQAAGDSEDDSDVRDPELGLVENESPKKGRAIRW